MFKKLEDVIVNKLHSWVSPRDYITVKTKDKMLAWLINGQTGVSSKALVAQALGLQYRDYDPTNTHPGDPHDFGRCLKLLEEIPELSSHLVKMKTVSPQWEVLVDYWDLVERYCREEKDGWRQAYTLMKSLYENSKTKGEPDENH